jgi:hypothetical protein
MLVISPVGEYPGISRKSPSIEYFILGSFAFLPLAGLNKLELSDIRQMRVHKQLFLEISPGTFFTTRTSRNQKGSGLSGKFQIPNNGVSFGQILNAFGEEHTAAFLSLKSWGEIFGL